VLKNNGYQDLQVNRAFDKNTQVSYLEKGNIKLCKGYVLAIKIGEHSIEEKVIHLSEI